MSKECGKRLHWNLPNITQEEARKFSSYLDRSNDAIDQKDGNESQTESSLSNTDSRGSSPSQKGTPPSSVDDTTERDGEFRITIDPVIENDETRSVLRPRYFELCVSNGSYRKKLVEMNITDIKSDGEFFMAMSDKYYGHRVSQMWSSQWLPLRLRRWVQKQRRQWLLKKPSSKEFRKVCSCSAYRMVLYSLVKLVHDGSGRNDRPLCF